MEKKNKIVKDFTTGPMFGPMVKFSLPFMASNLMQVLYNVVDMYVVGRYVGPAGMSAVTISGQIMMFFIMLAIGTSTGGQVYVSQIIGAAGPDKKKNLNEAIGTFFSIECVLAFFMTLVGIFCATKFISLINTPIEAMEDSLSYLYINSIGLFFVFGYNMIAAVLRGMGNSRHPFFFVAIATVLNVIFDFILVAKYNYGVPGAAWATVFSQGIAFLCALVFLLLNKEDFGFDFKFESWRIIPERAKGILALSIPFALQSCIINLSMLYVNYLVNTLGIYASATLGVGLKLDDLVNKVAHAMQFAVSAIVGQNYGAQKMRRIISCVRWCWVISSVLFVSYMVLLLAIPRELFMIFTDDENVLKLANVFALGMIWQFPALAIMKGTNGFIQGIGNAKLSFIFAVFDGVILRVLLSYFLGIYLNMGLYGFFLGFALATYGTAIPGLIYFLFVPWYKRKRVF